MAKRHALPAADLAVTPWIEQRLRQEWWSGHGCSFHALYGDDGEMQCNAATCMRDFKRDPMDVLRDHVEARRLAIAAASADLAVTAPQAQVEHERDIAWGELGFMKNDLSNARLRAEKAEAHLTALRAALLVLVGRMDESGRSQHNSMLSSYARDLQRLLEADA